MASFKEFAQFTERFEDQTGQRFTNLRPKFEFMLHLCFTCIKKVYFYVLWNDFTDIFFKSFSMMRLAE